MSIFPFLLRTAKLPVILAILAGLISGIANTSLIIVISNVVNADLAVDQSYILGFVALCAVVLVSGSLSDMLLIRLSQGAVFTLRLDLSRQILSTPLRALEQLGAPRLTATLTTDVTSVTNAIAVTPTLCVNLAMLLSGLFYLAWFSPLVMLVVAGFLAFGVFSYSLLTGRAMRFLTAAREEQDVFFKHIRALTDGIKELKLNARRREAFVSEQLEDSAITYRRQVVKGMTLYFIGNNWGKLLFVMLIGLLLFALPALAAVPLATITTSILIILYLMSPLNTILNIIPALGTANVAFKKIELLRTDLKEMPVDGGDAQQPAATPAWRTLELVEVAHSYHREREDDTFTLGPINLTFQPGELVFLIGGNGSGKTTLVKVLTGLYLPEQGQIRLDGQPINAAAIESYRQLFSVVFADFFLFEKVLGFDAATLDQQARRYLEQLHLEHKVQIQGGTLSTTELSQGQRKRLALLSAYLEDRPLYVFDEWAADQDPLFKRLFYTQILPELKQRGKTVFVITHDDAYFDVADRLIKLDQGVVQDVVTPHLALSAD